MTRTRFWRLILQLFLGSGLPALEFYDSGRLVEELPAFLRLTAQDLVNLALSDDGIALLTDTGIIKQLIDIFQAAGSYR